MASTEVEIANSALDKLGAEPITALTDTDKRAKLCNRRYATLRNEVLYCHPWNFALARVEISPDVAEPAFEYDHYFSLPSDCLRALMINDQVWSDNWIVEGRKILFNDDSIKLKYIKKQTDVTLYTPTFEEVLAFRMAWDMAFALTQSTTIEATMKKNYFDMLRQARSFDAQEGGKILQIDGSEWADSRY